MAADTLVTGLAASGGTSTAAGTKEPSGGGWLLASGWVLSRALMAWIWVTTSTYIAADVRYYFNQLSSAGVHAGLVEYPTPVVWFLHLLHLASMGDVVVFINLFVAAMALLDAGITYLLWRCWPRAAVYWTIYIFAVGSMIWYRIDLIPAVAVTLSLAWYARRPHASGVAMAIGAATKLWPAMLIGPLLGPGRQARARGRGFALAGLAAGLASLLGAGWTRSISPLTWQADRGLQIESVGATWPMLVRAFGRPGSYRVFLSEYNAWEIIGPGTSNWQRLSDLAMVAAVLLAVLLTWLIAAGGVGLPGHSLARAGEQSQLPIRWEAGLLSVVALICVVIVANKTFSPQYMIWLGGPLAILLAGTSTPRRRRLALTLAVLGLLAAGLTQLVFPLNYGLILASPPSQWLTVLLALRNLIMLAMAVLGSAAAVSVSLPVGRRARPPR